MSERALVHEPRRCVGNKAPIELIDRSVAYARADRNWLEKAQQPGPRMGSSPASLKLTFHLDHSVGANQICAGASGSEANTERKTRLRVWSTNCTPTGEAGFLRAKRPRRKRMRRLRRSIQRSGTIIVTPILSGLHHRFAR